MASITATLLINTKTGFGPTKILFGVACQNDEVFWTFGNKNTIELYSFGGRQLDSVRTQSENVPRDIAVSRIGDLLYTDYFARCVNLVNGKTTRQLIKLDGWSPHGVCCTHSDDILVSMRSDDNKQTKVVRYSGSTEIQSIQWDDQNQPLYRSGGIYDYTYLCENGNLDICVAVLQAQEVVVVTEKGKLRFRYTMPKLTDRRTFFLYGITTDSRCRILIADYNKHLIHILKEDGQFLGYINNCDLSYPWGVCVDSKDNLLVAENRGNVKKIKYIQTS